jgi:hypothetical protein
LIVGDKEPNQAQLKLYSKTAADLSKTMFLASGGVIFLPSEDGGSIVLGILGLLVSVAFFIAASRALKEVKDE